MSDKLSQEIRDIYYRNVRWQLLITSALVFIYASVIDLSVTRAFNLWQEIIFRLAIAIIAALILCTYCSLINISLYMPLAAPQAMLRFRFVRLILPYLDRFVQTVKLLLVPTSAFQSKLLIRKDHFALAMLFSLSPLPYRLYPLSCTQLE